MFSVLVSLLLSASASDGTPLDIRSFGVVSSSSGKDDYYTFESGPDGPYLAARYRPPFDTMVRGIEAPRRYHRTLAGIRWRWRVRAFPKGGDDCNRDVGDAAAGVFATFKAGLKVMVIKYIVGTRWARPGGAAELANNPFFAKREVVLRSGGETGTWPAEIVDPRRDFARFYGGKLRRTSRTSSPSGCSPTGTRRTPAARPTTRTSSCSTAGPSPTSWGRR